MTNDDSLQLRMKQLMDSYGLAGAMARGGGADSGNIYIGGSYLSETETSPTPKWYLAYFRIHQDDLDDLNSVTVSKLVYKGPSCENFDYGFDETG